MYFTLFRFIFLSQNSFLLFSYRRFHSHNAQNLIHIGIPFSVVSSRFDEIRLLIEIDFFCKR